MQVGDCLAAKLRPGNVHSADAWEGLLLPEIERRQRLGKEVVFRADAAFAKPEIYEALEECGVKYAIRIPANDSVERDISELLTRPVGRLVKHARYYWLLLAEGHLTRRLFGRMLQRIAGLSVPAG
ncbi:MAG: transposase [Terriglobia bacterium]